TTDNSLSSGFALTRISYSIDSLYNIFKDCSQNSALYIIDFQVLISIQTLDVSRVRIRNSDTQQDIIIFAIDFAVMILLINVQLNISTDLTQHIIYLRARSRIKNHSIVETIRVFMNIYQDRI